MEFAEDARKSGCDANLDRLYPGDDDVDTTADWAARLGGVVHVPPTDVADISRFAIFSIRKRRGSPCSNGSNPAKSNLPSRVRPATSAGASDLPPTARVGRIARCDALEITDRVAATQSLQGEHGALRVRALNDPAATRHLARAAEDLSTRSLHPLRRGVEVGHVEIVEPHGRRRRRRLGAYTTDDLPSGSEQLICAYLAAVGVRTLPAKELTVEGPCLLPVGGE